MKACSLIDLPVGARFRFAGVSTLMEKIDQPATYRRADGKRFPTGVSTLRGSELAGVILEEEEETP